MNRAIQSTAICGLLVLLIARTADAQFVPISNCTIITQPGSYIVTNNITATSSNVIAGACILINADFVTLNLAGFAITGSNLPASIEGIANFVGHNSIYVHSGTVANFSDVGVLLLGNGHSVEHIRAVNNSGGGISVFLAGETGKTGTGLSVIPQS